MQKTIMFIILGLPLAFSQTRVDLRTQSKAVDFTGAALTKPMRVGNALPATCQPGEFFYNLTAISGQNLYACASSGLWKATSTSSAVLLQDFLADLHSGTLLRVGQACSTETPCIVRFGATVFRFQEAANVEVSAGTGLVYIYIDQNGVLTAGHDSLSLSCSPACATVSGIHGFPRNSVPLYTWSVVNGNWIANGGSDQRTFLSVQPITSGIGVLTVDNGMSLQLQIDPSTIARYLKSSATLTIPEIGAGACTANLTLTVAGAALGNSVAPGWPSSLPAGLVGLMWVQAVDTVAVRLCNLAASPITPPAAVFAAMVLKEL